MRTKGVAILLSSDGKTWKLLDELNDWSRRPFTKEPKKNHIQWREMVQYRVLSEVLTLFTL